MVVKNYLQTTKTARYFTLGELNPQTQEIWIVLHGYAQLASDFIVVFESIATPERFIIAPEGLNRFYAKGFGGKPAATWMTSEDRENEISDYVNFLNKLCTGLNFPIEAKIILLGFSQGVATASRFLNQTTLKINHFKICSGELAAELINPATDIILNTPKTYYTSATDPFINAEKLDDVKKLMQKIGAEVVIFEGGHEVKPLLLI